MGEEFRCGCPNFFVSKYQRFYGVSAWKKGLKQCGQGGGGSFFVILCKLFYGWTLS